MSAAEDDDYGGELEIVHEKNGDVTMTHHADFGGDDEDLDQYADFGVNLMPIKAGSMSAVVKARALAGQPVGSDAYNRLAAIPTDEDVAAGVTPTAGPTVTHGWLWHLFHPGHKDA